MADSTLAAVQTKVRRLTRSPSEQQLSTSQINQYVNTALLNDFSEILRLFSLHTDVTFYTQPNVETYDPAIISDPTSPFYDPTSPLFDFNNLYVTVDPPIFIGGYDCLFTQSREYFYGIYSILVNIAGTGFTGDGITTTFSGNVTNVPFLQNNVQFTSIDANNNGLVLIDVPISSTTGNLYIPNDFSISYGTVNYITGAFTLTFTTPPANGVPINSQTVPYSPTLPQAMLYYNDKFTLRPVPDQVYAVNFQAYKMPTQLLMTNQSPELNQWWQYIAYLAAKKVFEDRMDLDSVALILPELKNQERQVLRKTIVQNTTQRVSTIYSQQTGVNGSWWGGGWGSNGGF